MTYNDDDTREIVQLVPVTGVGWTVHDIWFEDEDQDLTDEDWADPQRLAAVHVKDDTQPLLMWGLVKGGWMEPVIPYDETCVEWLPMTLPDTGYNQQRFITCDGWEPSRLNESITSNKRRLVNFMIARRIQRQKSSQVHP